MPFNWAEYLALAEHWAAGSLSEGLARSAVSRAYYAAYHLALDHAVQQLGYQRHGLADEHRWIRDRIADQVGREDIAGNLDELRQHRNRCDYDDEVLNLETVVLPEALDLARTIVDQLRSLRE